jgi:hypothetical protein
MSTNPITVTIEDCNVFRRRPCYTCGCGTRKENTVASFVDGWGDELFVCEECLAAGDIPRRLREQAEHLDQGAAALRAMAECEWRVPSIDEWRRAIGADAGDGIERPGTGWSVLPHGEEIPF